MGQMHDRKGTRVAYTHKAVLVKQNLDRQRVHSSTPSISSGSIGSMRKRGYRQGWLNGRGKVSVTHDIASSFQNGVSGGETRETSSDDDDFCCHDVVLREGVVKRSMCEVERRARGGGKVKRRDERCWRDRVLNSEWEKSEGITGYMANECRGVS